MKKLKLILTSAIASIVLFACSSDDNNNNNPQNCDEATAEVVAAAQAFEDATAENYVDLCNAYKDALQDQIAICGDPTGSLQDLIDGLDCTVPTTNGAISVGVGSAAPFVYDKITVTTTGTTRHVHGEMSNSTTSEIDFDVEVGQTGANKINNFQIRVLSQTYTPSIPAVFGFDWASNITVNSATSIVATFEGEVINASETSAQELHDGTIDIDF